ncbi:MAG: NAD(P)-dependent alcohol dehydrogenase [Bacteroidetes bacterium]|nr:NAD(P)-dependent alcohol dehydrogenase [Fibrella sp.]
MKAILFSEYGPADVLHLADVPPPTIKPNEVLIEVKAVSVNPLDWKIRAGYMAPIFGPQFPKRVGSDVAGIIREVGKDVSNYTPGDEVYGMVNPFGGQPGSFAEQIALPANQVSDKPTAMTFAEAASVPVVGLTALQGLLNQAGLVAGETVLVNGASGGVGIFAVQIAKILGATVTAVCSTANVETVRQLGADTVLDYTQMNVLEEAGSFDLVFDAVGKWAFSDAIKLVDDDGRFLTTNPSPENMALTETEEQLIITTVTPNRHDLMLLTLWINSGQLKTVIDSTFALSDVADAHRRSETGRVVGKVVVTVG